MDGPRLLSNVGSDATDLYKESGLLACFVTQVILTQSIYDRVPLPLVIYWLYVKF